METDAYGIKKGKPLNGFKNPVVRYKARKKNKDCSGDWHKATQRNILRWHHSFRECSILVLLQQIPDSDADVLLPKSYLYFIYDILLNLSIGGNNYKDA